MGWQAVANVGGIVFVCLDVLKKALELLVNLRSRFLKSSRAFFKNNYSD